LIHTVRGIGYRLADGDDCLQRGDTADEQ